MAKLNDVFNDWATGGGIFTALQDTDVPWKTNGISAALDLEYHGNFSGDKITSPLLDKYIEGEHITALETATIAGIIYNMFSTNWVKQWAVLSAEYNPIENYRMVEEMTDDETVTEYGKTNTRTDDLTHTKDGTETQTPDTTETETPSLITTKENGVYGFNSTAETPASKETATNVSGNNTRTMSGTDELEYDITETDSGTVTDVQSGEDTSTRNYHLERSGNIGVTTSQQMIESEINLWKWNFFLDVVFPDVDKVLTSPIY